MIKIIFSNVIINITIYNIYILQNNYLYVYKHRNIITMYV